jgi:hypothetical protein
MKYCLKYSNICSKLARAHEISIKYIEDYGLVEFLENHRLQRIILCVDAKSFEDAEVRKLAAIRKEHPEYNFTVCLSEFDSSLIEQFKSNNIPFYFKKPCTNWEMFNALIQYGVSDIDLSGPLAFEMSKVIKVLEKLEPKPQIRVTANVVKNLNPFTPSLVGFYIRPEDVDLYEEFIDVIEFEGLEHQDVFFSIYAEQKAFIGDLCQCIYGFKDRVDNKGLIYLFGERRRDCGRQCLSGGRCRRCYDLAHIAAPMGDRARVQILDTIKTEQEKVESSEN